MFLVKNVAMAPPFLPSLHPPYIIVHLTRGRTFAVSDMSFSISYEESASAGNRPQLFQDLYIDFKLHGTFPSRTEHRRLQEPVKKIQLEGAHKITHLKPIESCGK